MDVIGKVDNVEEIPPLLLIKANIGFSKVCLYVLSNNIQGFFRYLVPTLTHKMNNLLHAIFPPVIHLAVSLSPICFAGDVKNSYFGSRLLTWTIIP